MKKLLLMTAALALAGCSAAQQNPPPYQTQVPPEYVGVVPPDYPAQQAAGQAAQGAYYADPVQAQIEDVRRNYEEVRIKAQQQLDARKAAEAEKARAESEAKARAEARQAAARQAAAKEAARKAQRDEKYEDEQRSLDLQLKRLEVRKAESAVKVQEAVDSRKVERADELVDVYIQNQRAEPPHRAEPSAAGAQQ